MSENLPFWTRRRAAVQAEAEADAREAVAQEEAAYAELQASKDDATVLREMGLPDPSALEAGDDFAAFMAKEVPARLQNIALRKLWRSNPVLACVDGLNDYDDDFRAAAQAAEPIKTAYQVGKGMMAHLQEMARQQELSALAEDADGDVEDTEVSLQEDPTAHQSVEVQTPAPVTEAALDYDEDEDVRPRRMRFRFEEVTA